MRNIVGCLSMWVMACVSLGCAAPPESPVALSEPGAANYDQRLIGAWYSVDDGNSGSIYLEIRASEQATSLAMTAIATFADPSLWGTPDPVYWLKATAFASAVDGKIIYNVRRVAGAGLDYTAEGERPGIILMQAELLDDATLNLCPIQFGNLITELARRHGPKVRWRKVQGRFPREEYSTYWILDLSREELIEAIRDTPPKDMFKCFPPFRKVAVTNPAVWIK